MAIDSISTAQGFIQDIARITSDNAGRQAHAFSDLENQAFTFAEKEARLHLKQVNLVEGRDFRIDKDAIGNLLVTVFGQDNSKTVMAGSHLDSVLNGGKHDGVDGVASALAYLESFVKSEKEGPNYTFVVFRAEESSPMTGEACLGSKVLTGMITEERLAAVTYGLRKEERRLLQDVFGPRQWEDIMKLRDTPWIRDGTLYLPKRHDHDGSGGPSDMKVTVFNEVHIEQSAVLQTGGYHAGIVSHIGGSTNRKFTLDSSHLPSNTLETHTSPCAVWNLVFKGQEAHTGGTPHNGAENKNGSTTEWHRRDALVGACAFVQELLTQPDCNISVSSLTVPRETGFTTVPAEQHLTIHAPAGQEDRANDVIQKVANKICRLKDLNFSVTRGIESSTPVTVLDRNSVLKHVSIPLIVEQNARVISREVASLFGGKVRATVTDATLDTCGIRMNLNTRDINPRKRDQLLDAIRTQMFACGIDTEALFLAKAAVTEHIPLDTDVVRIAEEEAWALGQQTLTMPSQPSHDAACMQKAGVPTGMVYEAHDGHSHIATEFVDNRQQVDAFTLHHSILDRYTGIGTRSSAKTRMLRK